MVLDLLVIIFFFCKIRAFLKTLSDQEEKNVGSSSGFGQDERRWGVHQWFPSLVLQL